MPVRLYDCFLFDDSRDRKNISVNDSYILLQPEPSWLHGIVDPPFFVEISPLQHYLAVANLGSLKINEKEPS